MDVRLCVGSSCAPTLVATPGRPSFKVRDHLTCVTCFDAVPVAIHHKWSLISRNPNGVKIRRLFSQRGAPLAGHGAQVDCSEIWTWFKKSQTVHLSQCGISYTMEIVMKDALTPDERSRLMAKVRSKDTAPELAVRHVVSSLGFRYRLHGGGKLPGSPDLVFPRLRKVIFVHGCFWHRHEGCARCRTPKTRRGFWLTKFAGNVTRDRRNERQLRRLGWGVMVIWECQVPSTARLIARLRRFLSDCR
ncbi:MAG: very short patch repair endonuclease [Planctomycetaceae bacterium]|jgi:DNA mismatch endonuclease (patch repair protein)